MAVKKPAEKKIREVPAPQNRVETRTLLISKSGGEEIRIIIPGTARVTFGPTIPYRMKGPDPYERSDKGYSLRVYENNKNDSLMAVFSDVKSFRDQSIPHAKLIIRESGKSIWKSDEEGFKVEQEVSHKGEWVKQLEG